MPEYEASLTINAPTQEIFDFISDISNLPKYLPTTKSAQPQGENRVRVQGEANGHQYDADGYLRPNEEQMRLEWGADEGYYNGWMQIVEESDETSTITVHISLRGKPPGAPSDEGPPDAQIQEGLQKSLQSIQNFVEGTGGKEKPSAETS